MKTFTIAGTSNLNGVTKLRVANGTIKHRTDVLTRSGHTEINLVELPSPMTRDEARAFLELSGSGTKVDRAYEVVGTMEFADTDVPAEVMIEG